MRYLFSLTLTLFALTTLSAQSPWTKEKGGGFAQLSFMAIPTYSDYFENNNDTRSSSREYTEFGLQAYGEYGILDGTTIVGSIPLKILNAGDYVDSVQIINTQPGSLVAPGNLKLAIRQRIYSDGLAVAGQLGFEAPIGTTDAAKGLRSSYECWTVTPMLSAGAGLGKGYVYGYGGVGFRTNGYSHNFTGGIEGGYKFFKPLWTMLFLDINRSFKNGGRKEIASVVDSGFYVNDQEWVSLGLKLLFEINDNIGLTASTTLSAVAAHQVPKSPSVSIGVYGKWDGKKPVQPPVE